MCIRDRCCFKSFFNRNLLLQEWSVHSYFLSVSCFVGGREWVLMWRFNSHRQFQTFSQLSQGNVWLLGKVFFPTFVSPDFDSVKLSTESLSCLVSISSLEYTFWTFVNSFSLGSWTNVWSQKTSKYENILTCLCALWNSCWLIFYIIISEYQLWNISDKRPHFHMDDIWNKTLTFFQSLESGWTLDMASKLVVVIW